MANDYYTWAEYVAEVKKLLPIEAQRVGVGDSASDYLTSLIRQAVIDLQGIIPSFVVNHETIYYPQDMVREGLAMKLTKPPQSALRQVLVFQIDSTGKLFLFEAVPFPWEKRRHLFNGEVDVNDGKARYCIDPSGHTMHVCPMPEDNWMVSLIWDGKKLDFQDEEQVPFTERSALAVSYFVKAHTAPEVEDAPSQGAYWRDQYEKIKPKLYIDSKDER